MLFYLQFEWKNATNLIFCLWKWQVALRRQQAQEESEARELGLQLQYNNGGCNQGPVHPTSGSVAPTSNSPPAHPVHVSSPSGLAIAAAAAQIQTQLQHQQPVDCGILQRIRVPQDDCRSVKPEKNDNSHNNLAAISGEFFFKYIFAAFILLVFFYNLCHNWHYNVFWSLKSLSFEKLNFFTF